MRFDFGWLGTVLVLLILTLCLIVLHAHGIF